MKLGEIKLLYLDLVSKNSDSNILLNVNSPGPLSMNYETPFPRQTPLLIKYLISYFGHER